MLHKANDDVKIDYVDVSGITVK